MEVNQIPMRYRVPAPASFPLPSHELLQGRVQDALELLLAHGFRDGWSFLGRRQLEISQGLLELVGGIAGGGAAPRRIDEVDRSLLADLASGLAPTRPEGE